jgi:hypothetical protein
VGNIIRKQTDVGEQDIIIARFWVQNSKILSKTNYTFSEKEKLDKILKQLADDALSLRNDFTGYIDEISRYFKGIADGVFYEKKGDIQYFKEVFHGKKIVEDFFFHAELCKSDAVRFMRVAIPALPKGTIKDFYTYSSTVPNFRRLYFQYTSQWEKLSVVRGIRGVIEHSDGERDFEISDIEIKEIPEGSLIVEPKFIYPEELKIELLDGNSKVVQLKECDVKSALAEHFFAITNFCEDCVVFPLMNRLEPEWQPKLISLQSMDKNCPIKWTVEPATIPRRTVNHPPT